MFWSNPTKKKLSNYFQHWHEHFFVEINFRHCMCIIDTQSIVIRQLLTPQTLLGNSCDGNGAPKLVHYQTMSEHLEVLSCPSQKVYPNAYKEFLCNATSIGNMYTDIMWNTVFMEPSSTCTFHPFHGSAFKSIFNVGSEAYTTIISVNLILFIRPDQISYLFHGSGWSVFIALGKW